MDLLNNNEIRKIAETNFGTKNLEILNYSIKPWSDKVMGFLGEHFRLSMNIIVDGEKYQKHYFIKTVPRKNPKQSEYLTSSDCFVKEVECYDKLFYDIEKAVGENDTQWHPKYFYGRPDIIVLEDLSQEGFGLYREREPLDMDHAKIALKTLAAMHAQCLIFEEKISSGSTSSKSPKWDKMKNFNKIEIKDLYPLTVKEIVYDKEDTDNMFTKWMNTGVYEIGNAISEVLDGYTDSERLKIKTELPKFINELYNLSKYSHKFKNIFNQGDGWTNNFLFRYENKKPVEARVLDYQLTRYLPPAHDFWEILYITVNRELRERHEDELKKFYYYEIKAEMSKHGCHLENIISWESFIESCEYYRKLGMARASILLNIVLTPSEVIKKSFENIEEYEKFILNERGAYIKKCFEYEDYKRRNSELFHELIKRYIL